MIMKFKCFYESPLGKIIITSDGENLTGLWFENSRFIEDTNNYEFNDTLQLFCQTKTLLSDYFNGKQVDFSKLPVRLNDSNFRISVWKILQKIPYGTIITYGDIAEIIAKERGINKMSAQAVGGAVGHNPVSIIIPCHRVIGAGGNLTGYGGGIDKKIKLLELEKVDLRELYIPKAGNAT